MHGSNSWGIKLTGILTRPDLGRKRPTVHSEENCDLPLLLDECFADSNPLTCDRGTKWPTCWTALSDRAMLNPVRLHGGQEVRDERQRSALGHPLSAVAHRHRHGGDDRRFAAGAAGT